MRILLLASAALALAAGLILAVAFLARPAEPPGAVAARERDSAAAAPEPSLSGPALQVGSRSAQVVEHNAKTETPAAAGPAASIAGSVRVGGFLPSEPITLVLVAEQDRFDERRAPVASKGSFEFSGLPVGYRGRIQLPRRYRLIDADARKRSIAVEAPQKDLLLELVRSTCLTGRFVSPEGEEALEGPRMNASITWRRGGQVITGAEFEGNRFFVPVAEGREMGSVKLEVWTESGLRGTFEFEHDEIPPDLDLGVLALSLGGTAQLVVVDTESRPIPGALVQVRGVGADVQTDAGGRAALRGLPPDATLAVLARGFDPLSFPAPVSSEPTEVVLQRANRLTILVQDADGEPEGQARVRIASDQALFVGSSTALHPSLASLPRTSGQTFADGARSSFAVFLADEHGRIELQSLLGGMALTLRVEDELGCAAHEELLPPIRPEEQRERTIRITRESRSLSGLVTDQLGQPVEGATATLSGCEDSVVRTTDAQGRFQCDGIYAHELDVRVQRKGYVTARLPRVQLSRSEITLRIALDPGRDVLVRVLDSQGARVDAGSLVAWLPSEDRRWSARSQPDGFRLLEDVPARELELLLQLAGKEFRQSLPASSEEIVIQVPELGRLEVLCEPDPGLPMERLGLLLRSPDDGIEQWVHLIPTRTTPMEFEAVLPGSYELSFSTWEQQGSGAKFVPLRPPMRVQVAPGETTRVQLR